MNTPWKPILLSLSLEDRKEYFTEVLKLRDAHGITLFRNNRFEEAYKTYLKDVAALQLKFLPTTPLLIP